MPETLEVAGLVDVVPVVGNDMVPPEGFNPFRSLSEELQAEIAALPKDHADMLVEYIDQRLKVAREADPLGEIERTMTRASQCVYGDSQFDFAADGAPEKSASGGNRSGKTRTGCYIDVVVAGPDPYPSWWPERYAFDKSTPRFVWVACVDRQVQVEPGSVQWTILSMIPPGQIKSKPKVPGQSEALQYIEFWDGSRIYFKVYGAGRDVFQAAQVHLIHFDEEPPEDVYIEASQRGIEVMSNMMITYTPAKGVTWLYKRFLETGLIKTYSFATEDNPIVDLEELERRDRGLTRIERLIRRRGKTIPLVGNPRFDTIILSDWAVNVKSPPLWVEMVENPNNPDGPPMLIELEKPEDAFMAMALYVDPRNRKGWDSRFCIGVDSSDGTPTSDPMAAIVWDRHLNREAAVLHGQWDLELAWCPAIKRLSMLFHDAYVCAERNNMGTVLVKYLVNNGTPQYIQEKAGSSMEQYMGEFGWYTTVQAKSQAEAHAVTLMNQLGKSFFIYYEPLIHECLTYERKTTGVGEAAQGCHDDLVVAWMLAMQMDMQAPVMRDPKYHERKAAGDLWKRDTSSSDANTSYMGA